MTNIIKSSRNKIWLYNIDIVNQLVCIWMWIVLIYTCLGCWLSLPIYFYEYEIVYYDERRAGREPAGTKKGYDILCCNTKKGDERKPVGTKTECDIVCCNMKERVRWELGCTKMEYDILCCNTKKGIGLEPVDMKTRYETIYMI